MVIQAAQHPARAADPAPPPPGAHPDLLARVFPDEQSSSATAPNPYWEGSALAAMFNVLSDGKWHSLATLRNMFPVDVDKRLLSIRRRGEQEAVWDLQISQDHVRLATKK